MIVRRAWPRVAPVVLALAVSMLPGCSGDTGVDQPPRPLFQDVPIQYPVDLWDQGVEGEALVRVLVNETGGVDSVEVAESSGYAQFDSAAVRGSRELRFDPARRGDERVKVWAQVPVRFTTKPRPGNPD